MDTTVQLITGQMVTEIGDPSVSTTHWTFSMKTYEFIETDVVRDT
jgi:hypothetical protein